MLDGRSRDGNRELTQPAGVAFPFGQVDDNDRFSTRAASYKIDELTLRSALAAAGQVAEKLVARLGASCLGQGGPLGPCLETLIAERGALAFRRPLARDEVTKYAGLGTRAEPLVGRLAAAEHAFEALLMAPQFLFRAELGEDRGGKLVLGPYETAAALAYSLSDGPPDEPLWQDAQSGAIGDPAVIGRHVARLLGTPMRAEAPGRFVRELFRWTGTRQVAKAERFHDADELVRDTETLVAALIVESGRKDFLKTLLTSPAGFVSKRTAASYGRTSTGTSPERVTFLDGPRLGLLTQPSWLTAFSQPDMNDPVRRGRFVQESLLCGAIPEVTIDDIPQIPADPTRTLREKLRLHTENPTCRACHQLMDPMGLAFEAFDHYGRPRATEAGNPVDASGTITGSGDRDGPFADTRELLTRLASSKRVTECFVGHSFEYWLGRAAAPGDACTLARAAGAYEAAAGDYAALLQSLFTSDSFLARKL